MSAPVVRLKIRVRLSNGKRAYLDPVFAANGKLKPNYALVDGRPEHHPEGVYNLRYLRRDVRVWEQVGTDAQFALIAKLKREKALEAVAVGVQVIDDPQPLTKCRDLRKAVTEYTEEIAVHKSKKTWAAYPLTLRLFVENCNRNISKTSTGETSSPS